jgi:hypothetical protein
MPRSMTAPVLRTAAEKATQQPKTLRALNAVISASRPLLKCASHAVLGEGPVGAAVAFVGEQPGDQEDVQGRPFAFLVCTLGGKPSAAQRFCSAVRDTCALQLSIPL